MIIYILLICLFPIFLYISYIKFTSFNDRYIGVKNIYITTKGKKCKLIITDYDYNEYIMHYHTNDGDMVCLASWIKNGDHIIISGYGYKFNTFNLNLIITDIELNLVN